MWDLSLPTMPCRAGPFDGERASTMLRSCAEGTEHLGLVLPEDQFDSWVLGYVGHGLIKQICVCVFIYIWHSVPTPSGHGHVSAIVLSPFPPVVWWGCGTVPLPLWCGRGVVLSPLPPCSVCMTIYMTWWVQWVWYVIISCTMEHSDAAQAYITTLAVAQCFWTHR